MEYSVVEYRKKKIYSGHPPVYENKIQHMASLLRKYGWCFPPIPVTDMDTYYQAIDGTHRIAASNLIKMVPEIVVVED